MSSSSPSHSLVPVAVSTIKLVIPDIREEAESRRLIRRANLIDELVGQRTLWYKDCLFWRPWKWNLRLTSAEAEAIVDTPPDEMDELEDSRWYYTIWRDQGQCVDAFADRLEAAVKLSADGQVWLSLDDAKAVQSYLVDEEQELS